jgi:DNA-binding transcriptional LysR family regulator
MNPEALDGLTLQQFRSFIAAYELGSYAAAARQSDLSVPTVWAQVQGLEKQYGTPLFERSGRGVVPTDAGRKLYDHAKRFVRKLELSFEAVHDQTPSPRTLTILTGVRMTLEDLGPILAEFHEQWPHVTLRLLHGDNRKAEQLLANGEADLALAIDPGPGLRSSFVHVERAYRLDHFAVVRKRHPLAEKSRISLRELLQHPLILGTRDTYTRLLVEQTIHVEDLGGKLQVAAETDNSAYTFACVRAGLGVGVLAGRIGSELSRGLALISLEKILGAAWIVFLWRRGKELSAEEESFVNIVRQTLGTRKREST